MKKIEIVIRIEDSKVQKSAQMDLMLLDANVFRSGLQVNKDISPVGTAFI
jgi:hypothetical protein